jgi:diguanylate cyclase (GGDEF)-like protein
VNSIGPTSFTASTARLLAIDDSELIHRLLKFRLQHERLEIHGAINAREGLSMARELQPDVILLDIDMEDMNGFDVLTTLKNDPATQDIAVIFISGTEEAMDKVRALDQGAVDFVSKPFEVVELKARVRTAIRAQRLMKMLAQKAQIDGLTGLWNRSYMNQRLAAEVDEARRHGQALSMILCDIDRFKHHNDHFGHPFGDLVIERFAQILSGGRSSDVACRYGGEEFCVILPSTTSEEAADVANRYREQLERITWSDHPGLVVTASFGVADFRPGRDTAEAMLKAADAALYQAKQGGRNRVSVSPAA